MDNVIFFIKGSPCLVFNNGELVARSSSSSYRVQKLVFLSLALNHWTQLLCRQKASSSA